MKLYLAGGIAAIMLILAGYGWFEHNRYARVKAEFDGFVAQAQAIAAVQLAENQRKEKEREQRIKDAIRDRDAMVVRMRNLAKSASGSLLPGTSTAAGITETTCYNRAGLDAALSRFEEGIKGLVTEGDEAIINTRAWLSSWPKD